MTEEESTFIRRLSQSRTDEARLVERAQIIWQSSQGATVPMIAEALGVCRPTVRLWIKRFNAGGVDDLADEPRSGCPPTYSREQIGEVVATALTPPETVGLPFACWTLDRLAADLNERKGIAIKRSRISEVLVAEGLRWRQQETWFSERAEAPVAAGAPAARPHRVDPEFAQKRGPSSGCTRRRRPAASS